MFYVLLYAHENHGDHVSLSNKQEAQLKQGLADRTAKTAVSVAI